VQGAPGFYECKRGHRWHAKSSLRHHVCGMSKGDGHERCNFCWLADPPPPGVGQEWRTHPTESSIRQAFMTHRTTHHSSPTACRSCHETKQKRRDWTLLFSQICSNCSPSKPRRCPCCGAALLSNELQCFCCRSDVTPRPSNAASAPQLSKGVLAPAAQPQRSDEHSRAALPATPFTIHPSLRPFAAAPPAPSSTAGASSLLAPHTAMPAGLQSVARQGAERAPLGSRRSRRHRNSLHWLILCLAPLFFAFPVLSGAGSWIRTAPMPAATSGSSVGELVIGGGLLWNHSAISCAVSRATLGSLATCAGSLGPPMTTSERPKRRGRSTDKFRIRIGNHA
jgi:hypothetical protein